MQPYRVAAIISHALAVFPHKSVAVAMQQCATVDVAMAVPFAVATTLVAVTLQGMVFPLAAPVA